MTFTLQYKQWLLKYCDTYLSYQIKETDYNRIIENYELIISRVLHSNRTSISLLVFTYVVDEICIFSNQMTKYVMDEEYYLVGCDPL
jgi:hypothetical protein